MKHMTHESWLKLNLFFSFKYRKFAKPKRELKRLSVLWSTSTFLALTQWLYDLYHEMNHESRKLKWWIWIYDYILYFMIYEWWLRLWVDKVEKLINFLNDNIIYSITTKIVILTIIIYEPEYISNINNYKLT